MSDQKKEYKHQISSDIFIEAITATPEEFKRNSKKYKEIGIERVSSDKLKDEFNIYFEDICTVISNARIGTKEESIALESIKEQITPSIVILHSRLPHLCISNCILKKSKGSKTNFYFTNVETSDIFIHSNAKVGNFNFRQSQTGNFWIERESQTENFTIDWESQTGDFTIDMESQTGDFIIDRESQTGNFTIDWESQAGNFWIQGKSQTGDFTIEGKSQTGNFWIQGKSQTGGFWIAGESQTGNFRIEGKSQTEDFTIDWESQTEDFWIKGESQTGDFTIDRESQAGNFLIQGKSQTGDFTIDRESQPGNFTIDWESQAGNFWISGESQTGDFWIQGKSQTGDFTIEGKSQTGDFWIQGKSQTGDFTIEGKSQTGDLYSSESFLGHFSVNKSIIPNLRLNNCNITAFELKGQSKTEAFIRGGVINLIDLTKTEIPEDTTISFSSVQVNACLLDEATILGNLYFRNVKPWDKSFQLLKVENVKNTPLNPRYPSINLRSENSLYKKTITKPKSIIFYLKCYEVLSKSGIKGSLFRITYSSLGQTEFINSDLQSFNKFEFKHSRITEIFVSGLKAPTEIFINDTEDTTDEWDKEEQKVSFYNQFARVFEQQGFIYNAVKYRSKSALHQQKILWKKIFTKVDKKNKKYNGSRSKLNIIMEYLPFMLNRYSNNHGESWAQALLFIIVTSILLYIGYLNSLGHEFSLNADPDWKFIGYYFEFINPFRPFDFMKEAGFSINTGTRIVDFFSRVIIGYGFYQFLTAFRKYKKK